MRTFKLPNLPLSQTYKLDRPILHKTIPLSQVLKWCLFTSPVEKFLIKKRTELSDRFNTINHCANKKNGRHVRHSHDTRYEKHQPSEYEQKQYSNFFK